MTANDNAAFTSREFRNAMGQFASGVVVITLNTDEGPHAMTANAFMSGSLEPPLVVISVAETARMHAWLQHADGFGVSILTSHQEKDSNHFAGRRSPDYMPQIDMLDAMPVIRGAAVRLAADRQYAYACGDHTLFVGRVRALEVVPPGQIRPLLFYCGKYGAISPSDWSEEAAPARLWPEADGQWW
mgnify:CR=1 FL=1